MGIAGELLEKDMLKLSMKQSSLFHGMNRIMSQDYWELISTIQRHNESPLRVKNFREQGIKERLMEIKKFHALKRIYSLEELRECYGDELSRVTSITIKKGEIRGLDDIDIISVKLHYSKILNYFKIEDFRDFNNGCLTLDHKNLLNALDVFMKHLFHCKHLRTIGVGSYKDDTENMLEIGVKEYRPDCTIEYSIGSVKV